MAASNTPSIRELALAALARQHGDGEIPRETVVRRRLTAISGVSPP
jgi:hypothetical protein